MTLNNCSIKAATLQNLKKLRESEYFLNALFFLSINNFSFIKDLTGTVYSAHNITVATYVRRTK